MRSCEQAGSAHEGEASLFEACHFATVLIQMDTPGWV